MSYYVNEEFIVDFNVITLSDGNRQPIAPKLFLTVCDCQTVSYDSLKITDDKTGKILIEGSFGELRDRLHPKLKASKISYMEGGKYVFTVGEKGKSYKSIIPLEIKGHSKISLTSRWIEGGNEFYGLVLEHDNENFYAFELNADGKASFTKYEDNKKAIFVDNIEIGITNIKNDDVEQTIYLKDDDIELYINGQLVFKEKHTLKELSYIGIRICGIQTVACDKIEVWE